MKRCPKQAPAGVATLLLAELLGVLMRRWEPAQVHAELEARVSALLARPPSGIARAALQRHAAALLALIGARPTPSMQSPARARRGRSTSHRS